MLGPAPVAGPCLEDELLLDAPALRAESRDDHVVAGDGVYGIGTSQKNADLSLELAQDGALIMQLAEAFGGIHYMSPAQMEFIDNWEVEAYRQQQV